MLVNKKSRVKREFQARFRENVRVKFPRVTRLLRHEVVLNNCVTVSYD